jgi:hypothetical protein
MAGKSIVCTRIAEKTLSVNRICFIQIKKNKSNTSTWLYSPCTSLVSARSNHMFLYRNLVLFTVSLLMTMGQTFATWELPPFGFPANGSSIGMHSDANGNAIVVLDNSGTVEAFYFSKATNTWTGPTNLGSDNGTVAMDMDPSGTAIAVWIDPDGTDIHSSFFNGTSWTTGSPDPFATSGSVDELIVNMNGPNSALATWTDNTSGTFLSDFFSAGSWGSTIIIAGPLLSLTPTSSDYSSNGTAIASYTDGTNLLVANFDPISQSWQQLSGSTLDTSISSTSNEVARIDANGHAAVVWVDSTFNIKASSFNGTQWLPSVVLSVSSGNIPSSLSFDMAPSGTGVAVWVNAGQGFSSSYNGSTWASPLTYEIPVATDNNISVNAHGDALLLFQAGSAVPGVLLSTRLPLNGVWAPPEFLFNPLAQIPVLIASLSDNGGGFAAWAYGFEPFSYFASVEIVSVPPTPTPPQPPMSIVGSSCKDKFATQTDCVHIITWTPSPTSTVAAYQIMRNGILIGTVPAAAPLTFIDHFRCKSTDAYTVVAVDTNGLLSTPVTVIIR